MLNFQSLIDGRMLHVHINHGESDKQSMASNNAKAYDRVFVAGEAAVQRHAAGLLEFDTDRLVRIGRPQLDLRPEPAARAERAPHRALRPDLGGRRRLQRLHLGRHHRAEIVARPCWPCPTCALVYKPHPKVTTSRTPAVRAAHRRGPRARATRPAGRPGRRPRVDHARRHPGGDAGLRRDGHRRLLGRPGLALPAHRQADLPHRPPPRRRAAAPGGARSAAAPTSSTTSTSPR